jgi:4-hydroxy-tetrahydrodipicolinate reductase
MINIVISGIAGRMGSLIAELANKDPEINLIGGIDDPSCTKFPKDLEPLIDKCNVVIDFSTPEATIEHLKIVHLHKKAIVIGTTGFNKQQLEFIDKLSKDIPCVISPNMSVGVNLLFSIVQEITKHLPNYDIEITESHHKNKKDAPSGTAKKLAESICNALDVSLSKTAVYGRQGITGERPLGQIGIHAIRAGDIVGDHTIMWAGPGEVIELSHRALSRTTFANGAILAAKFLAKSGPGKYNMQDALKQKIDKKV